MSDFDKEAERERLREKYERDQQKRQATQRMSDLLLKGATMTNRHCGVCGDPLFRYDGQEFCPAGHGNAEVPEGAAGGEDDAAPADDPSPAADAPGVDADAPPTPADGEPAVATDEGTAAATDETRTGPGGDADGRVAEAGAGRRDEETGRSHPDLPTPGRSAADLPTTERSAGDRSPRERTEATRGRSDAHRRDDGPADGTRRPVDGRGSDHADDLDAIYESVAETLGRMAAGAEGSSNPRQVREYLSAAREAAETLNALDR